MRLACVGECRAIDPAKFQSQDQIAELGSLAARVCFFSHCNADRIRTACVNADRTQTESGALGSNADRTQTESGVLGSNADRTQTESKMASVPPNTTNALIIIGFHRFDTRPKRSKP
jgi:hypothetical protein